MLGKECSAASSNCITNYNGIDIVKFICSLLVVAIHIPVLNPPIAGNLSAVENSINTALKQGICRIAVPYFFVCSGFLLFNKSPNGVLDVERVKNYCFKMLRLLGLWTVLLFWGGTGHLWYLGATVVAVTLLSICLHYGITLKWMITMALVFYAFGLLGDAYMGLISPLVENGIPMYIYAAYDFVMGCSRNGMLMGFIFVLMGYVFAQGMVRLKIHLSLAGLFVSTLCMCAEVFWLEKHNIPADNNMYISLLPMAFFLFAFASSLSLMDRPIYVKLRTVGVLVYFLHLFINTGIWAIKKALYKFLYIDIQPVQFFITLTVTILVAFSIEWLSHKNRFKWIQWFLS